MLVKVNSLVQLLNWLVTACGVHYTIFIDQDLASQWWVIAQIGILVQLGGLLVDHLTVGANRSWLIVALIVFGFHLLIWFELFGNSIQFVMMGILISNLLFAYTISFVIKGIRRAFKAN